MLRTKPGLLTLSIYLALLVNEAIALSTEPTNVTEINSTANEFGSSITVDGFTLYLESTRTGGTSHIFVTTRPDVNSLFGSPSFITEINSGFSDGQPSISCDGLELFFISTRLSAGPRQDIFVAKRPNLISPFDAPSAVTEINDPSFQSGEPSVSCDGLTLYFNSDRPEDLDDAVMDMNIWKATRPDTGSPFGIPTSVTEVNSNSDDREPRISCDGLRLYFSSDRPGGSGDFDIWVSTRTNLNSSFRTPNNLTEINSSAADGKPNITSDNNTLYLQSDRAGGSGGFDIWVSTPAPIVINEVVTDPQQDWNETGGGNNVPFDDIPGDSSITVTDEFVELFNIGSSAIDLTSDPGWTLEFIDTTPDTLNFSNPGSETFVFSNGGSLSNFQPGEFLVIGNPPGAMNNAIFLVLKDENGSMIDNVELGDDLEGDGNGDGAPDGSVNGGNANDTTDESVSRTPNGTDTDNDVNDFSQQEASPTKVNSFLKLSDHPAGQVSNAFDAIGALADLALHAFRLTAIGETVDVTSIIFNLSNINGLVTSDLSGLEIRIDSNGDGSIQATEIISVGGIGIASIADTTGTITFNTQFPQEVGSTDYILIGDVSVDAMDRMNIDLKTTTTITAQGATSAFAITATGEISQTATHNAVPTLTIELGNNNPALSFEMSDVQDLEMLQLALTAGGLENIAVSSMTITASGTADDVADITDVELWLDNNNDGTLDNPGDTQINGAKTFSSDNGTATFSGLTEVINAGTIENWLVVYDLSATSASPGETFVASLDSITHVSATSSTSSQTVTPIATFPVTGNTKTIVPIVINEIVTDPQQDWNDTSGGNTTLFDNTPGNGTISSTDEWVELFNKSAIAVDLTTGPGWTLEFNDTTPATLNLASPGSESFVFSDGGSLSNFQAGEFLVIGNPPGTMNNDIFLILKDNNSAVVEDVELGDDLEGDGNGDGAPDGTDSGGNATGTSDETVARAPNGYDTDNDINDFRQLPATIGSNNNAVIIPDITITPTIINFGNVSVGSTSGNNIIIIKNDGTGDLTISGITNPSAPFSMSVMTAIPVLLLPGSSISINAVFSPTSVGNFSSKITITSDDPDEPNVNVNLNGTGVPPEITVTPTSLNLGNVLIGTSSSPGTIAIKNDGTGNLIVNNIFISGLPFFLSNVPTLPLTIPPSGSTSFRIIFTPTSATTFNGTVTINSNDSDESSLNVSLTGTGITSNSFNVVINEVVADPQQDWNDTNGGNGIPFDTNPGNGTISSTDEWVELLNKSSIAIDLTAGTGWLLEFVDTTPSTLNFSNPGTELFVFSSGGSLNNFQPGEFLVIGNPTGVMNNDIFIRLKANNGSVIDDVELGDDPEGDGSGDGTPDGSSNGGNANSVSNEAIARIPNGIDTDNDISDFLQIKATIGSNNDAVTSPEITVTPTKIDFSTIPVGTTSSPMTVTIRNEGTADLTITNISNSSVPFSLNGLPTLPAIIPRGNSVSFTATFSPTLPGPFLTSIRIINDDDNEPIVNVTLNGTGILLAPNITIVPNMLDFGNVLINTSSNAQTVTILNSGTAELTINSITKSISPFSLSEIPPLPQTLPPAGLLAFKVIFSPTDGGVFSDLLTINSNDPDESSVAVNVTGMGITELPAIVINEIVTDPQQDWNDTIGGNGMPFDASPGIGTVSSTDEWIEIYNVSFSAINLTDGAGWTVEFIDATPSTLNFANPAGSVNFVFSDGGSLSNLQAGEFLVVGNPPGVVNNDVYIALRDSNGNVVDDVELGDDLELDGDGDGAPDGSSEGGNATGEFDEALARIPNGVDTDDDINDFVRQAATIVANNNSLPFNNVAGSAGVSDMGNGTGTASADFDGDGDQDIYLANSSPNKLFRNDGDMDGQGFITFTDITVSAGVVSDAASEGVGFGDFDNDGDPDLYVSNEGPNVLFLNNGNGTFTDISDTAGVADAGIGRSIAWGDIDNDGDLDLYVVNFGSANVLYRNNGDQTFTDIADSAGVDNDGPGSGTSFADYDGDRDLDLYVVNFDDNNVLYRNEGNGIFTDVSLEAGIADNGLGNGAVFGDYDNDGDLDLYVTNENESNILYNNTGSGLFINVTESSGVSNETGSGRSSSFFDYDNDGLLDLYVVNGKSDRNVLFRNNGDDTFSDVTDETIVGDAGNGIGSSIGDFNNDGTLDIYVANSDGANVLYQNNLTENNFLTIRTVGTTSNRDGIGAKVQVTAGNFTQLKEINGGSGFLSQNTPLANFGLGTATSTDNIMIRWPSGITQELAGVEANQQITITEPLTSQSISTPTIKENPNNTGRHTINWKILVGTSVVSNYMLQRSNDSGQSFTTIATIDSPAYAEPKPGLPQGSYNYRVRLRDVTGNLSDYSPISTTVVVDKTRPVVEKIYIEDNPNNTGQHTLSWQAKDEGGAGIESSRIDRSDDGGVTFSEIAIVVDSSYTEPAPGLPDGTYKYRIQAKDRAGNLGTLTSISELVIVDKKPPEISITDPPNGSLIDHFTFDISGNTEPNLTITMPDPKDENKEISITSNPSGKFDFQEIEFTSGKQTIRINTADMAGNESSAEILVTINLPPILDNIENKIVNENEPISFGLNVVDSDGDEILISAINLPDGSELDDESGVFSWQPTYEQSGYYDDIVFSASDPFYSVSDTISITVIDVNRAPVFTQTPIAPEITQSFNVGDLIKFKITATDPDGDSLTYNADPLPAGSEFDTSTGRFSWMPDSTQAGTYEIIFTVDDGKEGSRSTTIRLIVLAPNNSPVFNSTNNQEVIEGELLQFSVSAEDADGDRLTYSASNLPSGAEFDSEEKTFRWQTAIGQAGEYEIIFLVEDGKSGSDILTVKITVLSKPNQSPEFNLSQFHFEYEVEEQNLLTFNLVASDPDGDHLNFSSNTLPAAAELDSVNGEFRWMPSFSQAGVYDVEFKVTDGKTGSDNVNIRLIVKDVPFTNMARLAGIEIIGEQGHGVAFGDYNADGFTDLYFVSFGGRNRLFKNSGNGTFTDVTNSAGVGHEGGGNSVFFFDYDNDDDLDIYLTNFGQTNVLYRNNGDGGFADITSIAGVGHSGTGTSVVTLDYNLDGYLDLFIVNQNQENVLYSNNKNGTFTDVTTSARLSGTGNHQSAAAADYNGDGKIDIYLVKDREQDILYHNNGDGTFNDVTSSIGLGDTGKGRHSLFSDFNNDGYLDLYLVKEDEPNKLYMNDGVGKFSDIASTAGVDNTTKGKSAVAGDFDNDGDLDIYLINGGVFGSPNILYYNNGDNTFTDVTPSTILGDAGDGYGTSLADYDNDGDIDIYLSNFNGTTSLFRNNKETEGNNWLKVKLVATESNKNGIGSKVTVTVKDKIQAREIGTGSGVGSQNDLIATFGLATEEEVDSISVRWQNGAKQAMTNVAANQVITLHESTLANSDLNNDGELTVADLIAMINMILGINDSEESNNPTAGDCNGDGVVDVNDLVCLINLVLGVGE